MSKRLTPRSGVRVALRASSLGIGDGASGYKAGLRLRRRLPDKELMDLARN